MGMESAYESVLVAEKEFFDRHRGDEELPLASLQRELEPIFLENGWRQPMAENPSVLLIHSEANGDFVMSSGLIREIRKCGSVNFLVGFSTSQILPLRYSSGRCGSCPAA